MNPQNAVRRESSLVSSSAAAHPLLASSPPPPNASPEPPTLRYQARARPLSVVADGPAIVSPAHSRQSSASGSTTATTSLTPTGSASWSAVPTAAVGSATSRLQTQSLQAAVQALGLGNESAAWAITQRILRLTAASAKSDPELEVALQTLASGRAVLLLPKAALASNETVTTAVLLDHIAVIGPALEGDVHVLSTLSGLRGLISGTQLDLLACISPTAPGTSLDALLGIAAPALPDYSTLPPSLPRHPSIAVVHAPTPLSIPRSTATPPPLPSRPPKFGTPEKAAPAIGGRLATLFGGQPSRPSTPPSASTDAHSDIPLPVAFAVQAWPVESVIRHVAVSRTIALSASARTLASLSAALGGDDGVKAVAWEDAQAEAVAFVNRFASTRAKSTLVGASADTIAIAAQDTYDRAREAAVARVDGDEATAEAEANMVIEAIERVLTAELYDRLFSPTDAADAGEDEALSSRIAALNLSDDLTLERLGLDVAAAEADDTAPTSSIRDDLDELVAACASELHKLSDHLRRSPAAKLAVLVQAHKIIVDRLSAMPPIPMKDERSPADGDDPAGKEIELQDDARSLGGRSANRSTVHSPELTAVDDALAVTPRPSSRPSSLQSSDSAVPALNLPSPSQPSSPAGSYFPPASRPAPASSADLILPLLIAAVVRANPARLVSTLRFIERFRAESLLSGEAAYCLTNASASVSFLSAVDLPSLSTLAPSPLTPTAAPIPAPRQQLRGAATNLAVAGASGLIEIAGAIDTGFRIFGGLLSKQPRTLDEVKAVLAGQTAAVKQHGLVRRASAPLLNVAAGDAANARARSQSDAAALRLRDAELDEKAELAAAEVRETASVARPSLGDRLASLARFSDRPSRPTSTHRSISPSSMQPVAPPIERFLTVDAADLTLRDVGMLLADYRRLAEALQRVH